MKAIRYGTISCFVLRDILLTRSQQANSHCRQLGMLIRRSIPAKLKSRGSIRCSLIFLVLNQTVSYYNNLSPYAVNNRNRNC